MVDINYIKSIIYPEQESVDKRIEPGDTLTDDIISILSNGKSENIKKCFKPLDKNLRGCKFHIITKCSMCGTEFTKDFGDLFVKIKAMSKVHLIIIDGADNIKKSEFDPWYKAIVSPTRGVWIGEGMGSQFLIKSTLTSRALSAKVDNTFGYFVDGSVTVLMKVITEVGEEDQIETL